MAIIPTRFDFALFDEDVFDFLVQAGADLAEARVDFEAGLDEHGHTFVWRIRNYTLDTDGSPTALSSVSDVEVKAFLLPVDQEKNVKTGRQFTFGKMKIFTLISRSIQVGHWIIDKDEDGVSFATIAGTSVSQAVLSGDRRPNFDVNDYLTINDSGNTGFYLITAVSFSGGETTLTVAFDADPGTGDNVFKTSIWKVEVSQEWPVNNLAVFRRCEIEKAQN